MTKARKATQVFGFLIVLVSISVAAIGFLLVREDIDDIARAGEENILWNVMQVEIELWRFNHALIDFTNHQTDASVAEVNRRYDILWSRVAVFQHGDIGARMGKYERQEKALARLFESIQRAEAAVLQLQPTQHAKAHRLLHVFAPHSVELRNLSRRVLHGQEAENALKRAALSKQANVLGVLSAVVVLASVMLILVSARESRRFRTLAEENQTLLDAAKKSGREKSQFLTMMSHELRTPINGVLGMLELISQKSLSKSRQRLVDVAKRSGNQISNLLGEIQDFAVLQDDRLKLDSKPFEPCHLLQSLSTKIAPIAVCEGVDLVTKLDISCPTMVVGDIKRIRQALTLLARYLIETVRTDRIDLEIRYKVGVLTTAISFDFGRSGDKWEPELIMGDLDRSGDKFVSAALGPAVARGLISKMAGKTKLHTPSKDRIAVLVCLPLAEMAVSLLLIRIITQSTALEAICKVALHSTKVLFLNENAKELPHVVLIEAGGENEPELVQQYARAYPRAMLVALGRPNFPDDFDDIVTVPLDAQTIQESKFMRLAS